jgi:hypothetical protein
MAPLSSPSAVSWVESLWPEGCLSPAGPWAYQIAIRACEPRDRQGSRIWRRHRLNGPVVAVAVWRLSSSRFLLGGCTGPGELRIHPEKIRRLLLPRASPSRIAGQGSLEPAAPTSCFQVIYWCPGPELNQ